ncbi:hypothetical protein VKT23_010302 [Stygiomarasmius scandens]|uniref:Uncharacterized protein n=1 Tax=Marasmiellus scandens TaxID=2682957 RepID=A0ABR1JDX3_9AGAR
MLKPTPWNLFSALDDAAALESGSRMQQSTSESPCFLPSSLLRELLIQRPANA